MPAKRESFMFEREVSKLELKVLRNWKDIDNRRGWKGKPDDTHKKVRLYIHEVFALEAWRKRDGGKTFNVVNITAKNKRGFVEHLSFADQFLKEGSAKVEALLDGADKDEMLSGLRHSQAWYEYIRKKLD